MKSPNNLILYLMYRMVATLIPRDRYFKYDTKLNPSIIRLVSKAYTEFSFIAKATCENGKAMRVTG